MISGPTGKQSTFEKNGNMKTKQILFVFKVKIQENGTVPTL